MIREVVIGFGCDIISPQSVKIHLIMPARFLEPMRIWSTSQLDFRPTKIFRQVEQLQGFSASGLRIQIFKSLRYPPNSASTVRFSAVDHMNSRMDGSFEAQQSKSSGRDFGSFPMEFLGLSR